MFDGKTFLPVTGTPIRKIACMMRPLADADPVPFAVAILNANSLTRSMYVVALGASVSDGIAYTPTGACATVPASGMRTANLRMSQA